MTDFTMQTGDDGVAIIIWDTKGKSMNVMTLDAWGETERHACIGRNPLAALELQPDGEAMAEHCAERGCSLG